MKYLFLFGFVFLSAAGAALTLSGPDPRGDKPILYWQTGPSPEARQRVVLFRQWLKEHHKPDVDLRIDPTQQNLSKTIIQGVSGVGGDLIQINIGAELHYLKEIGILTDLTDVAEKYGFGNNTFAPQAIPELTVDHRRYASPTMLYTLLMYVNKTTFTDLGLSPPPRQMDFATFERLGKAFVERANPPGRPHTRFFAESVNPDTMRRSLGLDTFNETLTACALDDPRAARVLSLIYKWTYEQHLLPSAADISSFSAAAGGNPFGPRLYQFQQGNLGIIGGGNYLIQALRKLGTINLAVIYPPADGFPNAIFGAGMLAVYRGSKHKSSAYEFLEFLASKSYNESVVDFGDGIPPNLKYAREPRFLNPTGHPNEAGCNGVFVDAIEQIGVPYSYSPFVPFSISHQIDDDCYQKFMAGQCSGPEAGKMAARLIDQEIQRTLHERPELVVHYQELVQRQHEIAALRRAGKPVPLEWILNPFYRKYYLAQGWAD